MLSLDAGNGSLLHRFAELSDRQTIFVLANLIIVSGYIFVAFKVTPLLPVRRRTQVFALLFFLFCAGTHLDQVLHTFATPDEPWDHISGEWHMLAIHVPQAVVVWLFVYGFYVDLRRLRTMEEARAERGLE